MQNIAQGVKNLFSGEQAAVKTYNVNANFLPPPSLEAGKTYKSNQIAAADGTALVRIQPFTEERDGGVGLCFRVGGLKDLSLLSDIVDAETGISIDDTYAPDADTTCVENPQENRRLTVQLKFEF